MLIRHASIPTNFATLKRTSFYPDYISTSVAAIDFEFLKQRGITTALIDLDGTVVPRGTYEVSENIRRALRTSGLNIYIATNRPKSRNLSSLKQDLAASGVVHPIGIHGKPSTKYFKAALREHSLEAREVVMIGDRYLQDIFGANRAGLQTLLVNKIGRPDKLLDRLFSDGEQYFTRKLSKTYTESSDTLQAR